MTTLYPDISSYNSGISVAGAPAVCCKVTEGTTYLNPDYARAKADAAAHGVFFFAYHFLHAGNAAAQAEWAHSQAGKTPLMVDFEPTTASEPGLADATEFIDEYRSLGGTCEIVYLPKWYWEQLGSPSLTPLTTRGLHLVASDYTSYSDSGPGWEPYGGMTPAIWQYTDAQPFNGFSVDFNAFKGSAAQLAAIAGSAPPPSPAPTLSWPLTAEGQTGNRVKVLQYLLNAHGAALVVDGDFGPRTKGATEAFQAAHGLGLDGIAGSQTWPALEIQVAGGATGDAVRAVQLVTGASVDGVFGPLTETAVESFQRNHGLTVDGIAGPLTWNAVVNAA